MANKISCLGWGGALILWSVTKINIKANEGDMTFLYLANFIQEGGNFEMLTCNNFLHKMKTGIRDQITWTFNNSSTHIQLSVLEDSLNQHNMDFCILIETKPKYVLFYLKDSHWPSPLKMLQLKYFTPLIKNYQCLKYIPTILILNCGECGKKFTVNFQDLQRHMKILHYFSIQVKYA